MDLRLLQTSAGIETMPSSLPGAAQGESETCTYVVQSFPIKL
jgi:hypothetical protein